MLISFKSASACKIFIAPFLSVLMVFTILKNMIARKAQILIPMVALSIVSSTAVLLSSIYLFNKDLTEAANRRVNVSAKTVENEINQLKLTSNLAAVQISENQSLIKAIISQNNNEILRKVKELQDIIGVDFCTVTDGNGNVLVRVHVPDYGDNVANQAEIKAALEGKIFTSILRGVTAPLLLVTGTPIYNQDENIIGTVSVGFRLDSYAFLDKLKEITDNEVTIFLGDERIATTVLKEDGTRTVGTKANVPLFGAENEVVGMILVGEYTDSDSNKKRTFIASGIALTLIVIVAAILVAIFITGIIERQLANCVTFQYQGKRT
jgi:methyl-accepting chemotaxis protein